MKTYRLKHIPTGLYYKPFKGSGGSNLSKKGKVYINRKPNMNDCLCLRFQIFNIDGVDKIIREAFGFQAEGYISSYVHTKLEDWVLEEKVYEEKV